MKKLSALVSVLLLGSAISLAACKKDEAGKPADTTSDKPVDTPVDKPADTAAAGDAPTVGIPECDAYIKAAFACAAKGGAAGKEAKEDVEFRLDTWKEAGAGTSESLKESVANHCKELVEKTKEAWTAEGC
jgi:hypothetical protein